MLITGWPGGSPANPRRTRASADRTPNARHAGPPHGALPGASVPSPRELGGGVVQSGWRRTPAPLPPGRDGPCPTQTDQGCPTHVPHPTLGDRSRLCLSVTAWGPVGVSEPGGGFCFKTFCASNSL
uniref:Small integral membrane protein 38 n=1 Tax=Molossus molossus TaxID=27622 RepID=A0A7J8EU97_MOLMO|nr:small integral membrane protein 38 [Molossus molossus]